MNIKIDQEFKEICSNIVIENKNDKEWSLVESSDMFQTDHYCGGYDATENAFCFSYYDNTGKEFWLQITLKEVKQIMENKILFLEVIQPLT